MKFNLTKEDIARLALDESMKTEIVPESVKSPSLEEFNHNDVAFNFFNAPNPYNTVVPNYYGNNSYPLIEGEATDADISIRRDALTSIFYDNTEYNFNNIIVKIAIAVNQMLKTYKINSDYEVILNNLIGATHSHFELISDIKMYDGMGGAINDSTIFDIINAILITMYNCVYFDICTDVIKSKQADEIMGNLHTIIGSSIDDMVNLLFQNIVNIDTIYGPAGNLIKPFEFEEE